MKASKILSRLRNKVIYVAFIVLFCMLLEVSWLYGIPLVYLICLVCKRDPSLFFYIGFTVMLILMSMASIMLKPNFSRTAYVKGDIKNGDITSFTAVQNGLLFKVYTDQEIELHPGNEIMIQGELQENINQTIPNTFHYKNYLKSKRIKYTVFSDTIDVVGHRYSVQSLRYKLAAYIDRNAPLSGYYIKTFILADQSGFEEEIEEDINILGVSHLFAVSGLHIGLLTMAVDRFMKKYLKNVSPQKVIIPLLGVYMIITAFSPSVIRAGFLYIGIFLNKKYRLELSLLDILSLIFLLYLIASPFAMYSLGFSLSFLVTFSIILGQYILKGQSTSIQLLLISILAMLIALPITVSVNKEINLLTIFVNVFLIYGMSFIILPFGYITFVLPFLDSLYFQCISLYEMLIQTLARVSFLRFDFSFISHLQVISYYVFLLMLFMQYGRSRMKKQLAILVLFLLFSSIIQTFNPVKSLSMIDIYGDSIFVKDSFDRCNLLIDTGDSDDYNSVVTYLKGKGIRTIDYLIVTHEHADHNGERADLKKEFTVLKEINSSNVTYGDLHCGSLAMRFFPFEKEYSSENNKSLVFSLRLDQITYLFTGDMEYRKEEEFASLYDINVDVLKSGHHGSITSSSDVFLDSIKAEEVWISCYRRNLHKHPHEEIISRYKQRNMSIFRTDTMGTIEQYYIFGKGYKRLHKP